MNSGSDAGAAASADANMDMTRDDLRARIDASWAALWQMLEQVPEARRTESGAVGFWSVNDLVGHIAWWDDFASATAETIIVGTPEPEHHTQSINERVYAERHDWSWAEAVAEAEAAHARLLATVERMPETISAVRMVDLADDCYDHYDEHVDDLTAWLARDADAASA